MRTSDICLIPTHRRSSTLDSASGVDKFSFHICTWRKCTTERRWISTMRTSCSIWTVGGSDPHASDSWGWNKASGQILQICLSSPLFCWFWLEIFHQIVDLFVHHIRIYVCVFVIFVLLFFSEPCYYVSKLVQSYRCTNSYSYSDEDTTSYDLSWSKPVNSTPNTDELSALNGAFLYSSEADLNGDSFEGQVATYSGGGYVGNLGVTLEKASELIDSLESNRWIDHHTRAIFVEFSIFNVNSGMANMAVMLFEYPADGSTLWSQRMDVVQLYRYMGPNGVIALLSEVACALFVLILVIVECRIIFRQRRQYFKSFWNWIQLSIFILFFTSAGLYAMRCMWTMWVVEDMINNPGYLINLN